MLRVRARNQNTENICHLYTVYRIPVTVSSFITPQGPTQAVLR